jgi:outer membrane protein OmpA-like peptidoglycan-associated protein
MSRFLNVLGPTASLGLAIFMQCRLATAADVPVQPAPTSSSVIFPQSSDEDPSIATSEEDKEWARRDAQVMESSTQFGGAGLLRTQHAEVSAPGQFRLSLVGEWFSASFLCTSQSPCPNPNGGPVPVTSDTLTHTGGTLTLGASLAQLGPGTFEGYAALISYANSDVANRPALLQVLGDSDLGIKYVAAANDIFAFGGFAELWLINGSGSVGLSWDSTSARFGGIGTADLRGLSSPVPLRFSANVAYFLDNTADVLTDTENARGVPVTRIERYGLGVNRIDHFDFYVGAEALLSDERVRPFVETHILAATNRQGYVCPVGNPGRDGCLKYDLVVPSTLTLGARVFPWKREFSLMAALDIGIGGTSQFIEELQPVPPWTLYLGAGWAVDTWTRPVHPIVQKISREPPVPRTIHVAGFVHEKDKNDPVVGAIVAYKDHADLSRLATGPDGRFSDDVPPGTYAYEITAEGFKPAICAADTFATTRLTPTSLPGVPTGPSAGPSPTGAASSPAAPATGTAGPSAAPSTGSTPPPSWAPPPNGYAGAPPPAAAATPVQASAVTTPGRIDIDCPMEALPRVGTVTGHVRDSDTSQPLPGISIGLSDAQHKDLRIASDASGGFRFEGVAPGTATLSVIADGYLALVTPADVKARQESTVDVLLQPRPRRPDVQLTAKEITIRSQIQFALDSAVILPQSFGELTQVADTLIRHVEIKRLEVQGHSDNSGTADHNTQLSQERAEAVAAWLVEHGVPSERLTAHGYGQTKPLVPNVTAANRAQNRRVQFVILEKEGENKDIAPPASPHPASDKSLPGF